MTSGFVGYFLTNMISNMITLFDGRENGTSGRGAFHVFSTPAAPAARLRRASAPQAATDSSYLASAPAPAVLPTETEAAVPPLAWAAGRRPVHFLAPPPVPKVAAPRGPPLAAADGSIRQLSCCISARFFPTGPPRISPDVRVTAGCHPSASTLEGFFTTNWVLVPTLLLVAPRVHRYVADEKLDRTIRQSLMNTNRAFSRRNRPKHQGDGARVRENVCQVQHQKQELELLGVCK